MSVVEDTRKVLQDFIAPELRAVTARIEALEKKFDESERGNEKRFDQVGNRFADMEKNLDEIDVLAQKSHEQVMMALNFASEFHALRERVARLEAGERPPQ